MKKRILMLLLAAAIISLTGCFNSEIGNDEKENENYVNTTDEDLPDLPNNEAGEGTESIEPSNPAEFDEGLSVTTAIVGENAILNISPVEGALGYEIHVNGTLLEKISETVYSLNNTQINIGLNEISVKAYDETGYIQSGNTTIGKLSTPKAFLGDKVLYVYQNSENAIGYKIYNGDEYITNIRIGETFNLDNPRIQDGAYALSVQAYGSASEGWLPSEKESVSLRPTSPSLSLDEKVLTVSLSSVGSESRPEEETFKVYLNNIEVSSYRVDKNTESITLDLTSNTLTGTDTLFELKVGDVITVESELNVENSDKFKASIVLTKSFFGQEEDNIDDEHICDDQPSIDPNNPSTDKPVIYLYPEETMEISVKLDYNGKFTSTYPKYNDGWEVIAEPDGTISYNGREYYCLFWEGISNVDYSLEKGFCVNGEDTEKFLEDSLKKLGLTDKEANEFIIYWLPKMENNEYNIISFQKELYTDNAELTVSPAPDTLIRVFMAWQGSDKFVEIEPQNLTAPERIGFTVVEWGGSELK